MLEVSRFDYVSFSFSLEKINLNSCRVSLLLYMVCLNIVFITNLEIYYSKYIIMDLFQEN